MTAKLAIRPERGSEMSKPRYRVLRTGKWDTVRWLLGLPLLLVLFFLYIPVQLIAFIGRSLWGHLSRLWSDRSGGRIPTARERHDAPAGRSGSARRLKRHSHTPAPPGRA